MERGKPSFTQLQVHPEILGKQEKDIHRHPICAATIAEPFPVAKVCAGRGRLPGLDDVLSCKWCRVIEGTSQQQRTFFPQFDPSIEKETKQLPEREAALAYTRNTGYPRAVGVPNPPLVHSVGPTTLYLNGNGERNRPLSSEKHVQCFLTTLFFMICKWHWKQWKKVAHKPSLRKIRVHVSLTFCYLGLACTQWFWVENCKKLTGRKCNWKHTVEAVFQKKQKSIYLQPYFYKPK